MTLLKIILAFVSTIADKVIIYFLGKTKRKQEEAEEDLERAKKDAAIDNSGNVSGDDLRDRLRNK